MAMHLLYHRELASVLLDTQYKLQGICCIAVYIAHDRVSCHTRLKQFAALTDKTSMYVLQMSLLQDTAQQD
jgi:hypothetical protein